jgi:putative transposase
MPNYRRNFVAGGTYFFTVVTQNRRPILTTPLGLRCLRNALSLVLGRAPVTEVAFAILPDHFHAVWTLPDGDAAYPMRWKRIKEEFTRAYLAAGGMEGTTTENRKKHQERAVWQPRYWEHTCRDEDDLEGCVNYVHWNPVKHGLVTRVRDYPWSSFHDHVAVGLLPIDWGDGPGPADIRGAEWD